jgi:hypothetical protein
MADETPSQNGDGIFRHVLAGGITTVSIIGVIALAIVIALGKADKDRAQLVFSAVLPVVGTWVGTVLAYYFSKENLDAATRSVTSIANQLSGDAKLRSRLVTTVMIPKSQMFSVQGPAASVNLVQTLAALEQAAKGDRIPILDPSDAPLYVVHRSIVDRFISSKARTNPAPQLNTLTLQDMLNTPDLKPILEASVATVSEKATLADAKAAMDASKYCQDVFVTKAGTRNEAVAGWITNSIIEDNAKV